MVKSCRWYAELVMRLLFAFQWYSCTLLLRVLIISSNFSLCTNICCNYVLIVIIFVSERVLRPCYMCGNLFLFIIRSILSFKKTFRFVIFYFIIWLIY